MTDRRIAYDPELVIAKLSAQLADALARCARLEAALEHQPEQTEAEQ